jgi:hypothetical protein
MIHIDNPKERAMISTRKTLESLPKKLEIRNIEDNIHWSWKSRIDNPVDSLSWSEDSSSEDQLHHSILDNCKAFLTQSKVERKKLGWKRSAVGRVIKEKADNRRLNRTFES